MLLFICVNTHIGEIMFYLRILTKKYSTQQNTFVVVPQQADLVVFTITVLCDHGAHSCLLIARMYCVLPCSHHSN